MIIRGIIFAAPGFRYYNINLFKIRYIIHVLKNACWLLACLILWAFTVHEKKVYEIGFLCIEELT